MATYSANEFKNGLKLLIDNDPCSIVDTEFVKPGKGQAFVRVKYRNLKTGRVLEKTYKSAESVEAADVMETEMQYLYHDGEFWHFMVEDTFEQHATNEATVSEAKKWLKEQDICTVTLWNGEPILVEPPQFVQLKVIDTEPGIKGDTVSGGNKAATLETGAVIRVPLFIEVDEIIKVNTQTGEYVSRIKS